MVATDESSSTLKVQLMSPPSTNGTNKANQVKILKSLTVIEIDLIIASRKGRVT